MPQTADDAPAQQRHSLAQVNIGGRDPGRGRVNSRPTLGGAATPETGDTEQGSTPPPSGLKVIPSNTEQWLGVKNIALAANSDQTFPIDMDIDTLTIYCPVNGANDSVFFSYAGERCQLPSIGTEVAYTLTLPARGIREISFYNRDAAKVYNAVLFMCRGCDAPVLVLGIAG